VVEAAVAVSARNKEAEGGVWLQSINWGFPSGEERPIDTKRVGRFAKLYGTELTGFAAYLGGAVAQEVIKKTGKFTPIDGGMHHEDHALIPAEADGVAPAACAGTRYDDYIAVLGADFIARAVRALLHFPLSHSFPHTNLKSPCAEQADQRVFLVGAGALGCEYLKGISLMGVATGPKGKVLVTDMDTIETSNLSRQFLFRDSDVGSSKSKSGARVVKEWNPSMNIEGVEEFVGPTTEDKFTDEFWEGLDLCWNALDNIAAR
jgi:ubiquitin-activating enzyme E1